MLTEIRKLVFPQDDLLKAVTLHSAKGPMGLPEGDITAVKVDDSTTPGATVKIRGESVALDGEFLLAAMVRYCIDSTIPMPRKAEKSLDLVDGQLALNIFISETVKPGRDYGDYYVLL